MVDASNTIVRVQLFSSTDRSTVQDEVNTFLEKLALDTRYELKSVEVSVSGSATVGGSLAGSSSQRSTPVFLASVIYTYPSGKNPLQ